jgi:GMP synthase-like glutamine amidotransferase
MAECSDCNDAFTLASRSGNPMNVVAVIQHTSGEYLGLMEDHLEGRRIRFQYFRPFAGGRKLPAADLPADALILLGGGPWGTAGGRDLPTLAEEVAITRAFLDRGVPVVGFGLGAQILAIAAGGGSTASDLVFEIETAKRTEPEALNGYLPEAFHQVVYMRDWPAPPEDACILARDSRGRVSVFQISENAYGFVANPGIKLGMVEDLIMEFEEVPEGAAERLADLRPLQSEIEDELVPIMTGLVQRTSLMASPKATESERVLDRNLI